MDSKSLIDLLHHLRRLTDALEPSDSGAPVNAVNPASRPPAASGCSAIISRTPRVPAVFTPRWQPLQDSDDDFQSVITG